MTDKNIKMTSEKMIGMSKDKEYKNWRKSIEKDSESKSIAVEECENGFIIRICKYNYKESGEDYSKTYISTKNPLEGEKEYKEEIDATKDIMKAIDALDMD